MKLKKKWDNLTKGWFGWIIYMFLGFIIAYSSIAGLGMILNTDTPVVSVFSCSMEHDTTYLCMLSPRPSSPDIICGQKVTDYDNTFDSFWETCSSWYIGQGITKHEFMDWKYSHGLSVGDMLVVYNKGEIEKGDIVVFNSGHGYPIIHRAYEITDDTISTKGDRNPIPDSPTPNTMIHGKAVLKLPLLGWVKIIFTEITGIA